MLSPFGGPLLLLPIWRYFFLGLLLADAICLLFWSISVINDGDFRDIVEQSAIIRIECEVLLLSKNLFDFLPTLHTFLICLLLVSLHQEYIYDAVSLSARPAYSLQVPDVVIASVVANDAINFSNVQSLLPDAG